MKTINMKTEIGPDGNIHLEVPCNLPPGPAEIVVVIQPLNKTSQPLYDTFEGVLKGVLPDNLDVDAARREMSEQWKQSLEPPP